MKDGYLEVPVFAGHDPAEQVGQLLILKSALPVLPDWHLSLGYRALEMEYGIVTEYELKEVSITSDSVFYDFPKEVN